jgi:hypothetical protein
LGRRVAELFSLGSIAYMADRLPTEDERKQLCEMLDTLDIGYRWDGNVLLVPIGVEAVVDSCLDSIDTRGVDFIDE